MKSLSVVKSIQEATHVELLEAYENSGLSANKVYEVRNDNGDYYIVDDKGEYNYAALIVPKTIKYKIS